MSISSDQVPELSKFLAEARKGKKHKKAKGKKRSKAEVDLPSGLLQELADMRHASRDAMDVAKRDGRSTPPS
jgi:hypothetical protein